MHIKVVDRTTARKTMILLTIISVRLSNTQQFNQSKVESAALILFSIPFSHVGVDVPYV